MFRNQISYPLVIAATVVVASPRPAIAARRVTLTLVERAGVERVAEPVTSGIPIPKGELHDAANARLLCDSKEVPAQFRAVGYWRPEGSIRWLLIDFLANIKAGQTNTYLLEYGEGVTAAIQPPVRLRTREEAGAISIDTGVAEFVVGTGEFGLLQRVSLRNRRGDRLDVPLTGSGVLRGVRPMVTRPFPAATNTGRSHLIYAKCTEGAVERGYTLRFVTDREYELSTDAGGAPERGSYLKDFVSSDDQLSIPADAWLQYAYPRKGDEYTFRTMAAGTEVKAQVTQATLLETGPLRAVLELRGWFGARAPVLEFTARYHFFAGTSRVHLAFTLENNNHGGRTSTGNANNANIGGINCVFFDGMSLHLGLPLDAGAEFELGGAADLPPLAGKVAREVELYQDSGGGDSWARYRDPKCEPRPNSYVTFRGYKVFDGGREVAQGDRALGWFTVADGGKGLTVAVRDFWQNFPKLLTLAPQRGLEVGLFPARYGGDFAFRSGQHKTHELLFAFHADVKPAEEGRSLAAAFSEPLRLEPRAEWFAETRALGVVHPFDPARYRDYEIRNLSTIGIFPAGVPPGPSLLARIEENQFYGWMDYGDVPIDFEAPSGQWGMKYDFDLQMARQWARTLRPDWWRLFAAACRHTADTDIHHQPHYPGLHYVKGGVWAHSLHGEPGHRNPHRNYNHFTKDLCFGARGTAAFYYLTGDLKAREACLEIATNALAEYMSPQSEPDPAQNNRMGWRGDACTLNRLLEGYELTGATNYLERARWQIQACAFDGKPAKHGPISLWSSLFYMMALARYVELFPEDVAAGRYLLCHLETLRRSVVPRGGIYYEITPQPDGSVVGKGECSHYNIMAADALAIAYQLTRDTRYLSAARQCFAYGVRHACWKDGPPTYFQVHSANGATHGNVFMAVAAAERKDEGG